MPPPPPPDHLVLKIVLSRTEVKVSNNSVLTLYLSWNLYVDLVRSIDRSSFLLLENQLSFYNGVSLNRPTQKGIGINLVRCQCQCASRLTTIPSFYVLGTYHIWHQSWGKITIYQLLGDRIGESSLARKSHALNRRKTKKRTSLSHSVTIFQDHTKMLPFIGRHYTKFPLLSYPRAIKPNWDFLNKFSSCMEKFRQGRFKCSQLRVHSYSY